MSAIKPATQATADAAAAFDMDDLADGIALLSRLAPIDRARQAKVLGMAARRLLADAHHEAVYAATRGRRWDDVAAELGVSKAAVNLAVTQHLGRTGKGQS